MDEPVTKVKAPQNKFAKWAILSSYTAILVLFVLLPFLGTFFGLLGIILGILGIRKYNSDNSLKGKTKSIVAISIGAVVILVDVIKIIILAGR